MTYIITTPFTRQNELWVDNSIECSPVTEKYCHPIILGTKGDVSTLHQANFYKYIGLDIVTETVYNYPYPYITEKTLRPIACKRLFVVVGPPGVLALLHSKGFETFSDVLDESYDTIQDPHERFWQLQKTIKEFVLQPLDTIIDVVKLKTPALEHNFEVLKKLQDIELQNLNDSY
jgi:hypothetical protein